MVGLLAVRNTWSKICQVEMKPSVRTSPSAGRNIGRVTCRNLCQPVAPSISLASSSSSPMLAKAAKKKSINVPEVVNTARIMMKHIPSDGPESQSQTEIPRTMCWAQPGGLLMPKILRNDQKMPCSSSSQFGPLMPNQPRIVLTAPDPWNKKMKIVVMAIELVTYGK